ncbi:MAG TPA: asparagine synthase-related protein [Actinomycetota bacterium]|jgi:hypothetical protein|nr:asparagine synthase-related protein [Actinomycetota bacterium]
MRRIVHRLPGIRSVVGAIRLRENSLKAADSLVDRLLDVYRPLLGDATCVRTVLVPASSTLVVAISEDESETLSVGDRIVWGTPVGDQGEASEDEIDRAITDPVVARGLMGVYVLIAVETSKVSMVTSAALPKTLLRVDGPNGSALATKGLAGQILAGVAPNMSEEVIADFVVFGFPVGDDELLSRTVVEEATAAEFTDTGLRIRSYWPPEERLAPGPPTTPGRLREVLGSTVGRMSQVPGVRLALTAGRDSSLVAACLNDRGRIVESFTLGSADSDDGAGAARTARLLGWSHHAVPIGQRRPPDEFAEIVRWAPWHEGMQRAWDYAASWLDWDVRDLFYVGGHGGEIGRSFYGAGNDDALSVLARRMSFVTPRTAAVVRDRIGHVLDDLRAIGRPDADLLDLFYAKYRARHLFIRFAPFPQFRSFVTPYLEPGVVSALLDAPVAKRDGSLFDETLESISPQLRVHNTRRAHVSQGRLARRIARWRAGRTPALRSLRRCIASADEAPYVASVLGAEWWSRAMAGARRGDGFWFWRLWNALAVESLHVRFRLAANDKR